MISIYDPCLQAMLFCRLTKANNKVLTSTNILFPGCYCECQMLSKSLPMIAGHVLEYHMCSHSLLPTSQCYTEPWACSALLWQSCHATGDRFCPCCQAIAVTEVSVSQCQAGSPARMSIFHHCVIFHYAILVFFSERDYNHLIPVPLSTLTDSKSLRYGQDFASSYASQIILIHIKVCEHMLPTPHRILIKSLHYLHL